MKLPALTRDEFIERYARSSKMTIEELLRYFVAVPCDCDYHGCQGWKMINRDSPFWDEKTGEQINPYDPRRTK